jgi:transcriptional regulator with XRE-family HTH domain
MTFKAMREAAGLTQVALAERAKLDQTTVSQIETGKIKSPQFATVAKLAKALGKTVEEVAAAIAATVAEVAA